MSDQPNEAEAEAEATAVDPAPQTGNVVDFQLRGAPPRVTRLSRKVLAMMGVAAGIGIGGSLIYALQSREPAAPRQNVYDNGRSAKADVVTAAPADYSKVPKLGPPLPGDLGRPILNAQANGQMVPAPPMGVQASRDQGTAAAEQARQRIAQERESARSSSLFLGGVDAGPTSGAGTSSSPSAQQAETGPNVTNTTADTPSLAALPEGRAFLQVSASRATSSGERLTAPISPYVIQAGSIIPAALITGIRSDLPGQITAQVTENVYDSPTGRTLLIPQGSRLIGEYDSKIAAGQNRALLAWDRLILPGGRSILLDRQPGADASGRAGLQDRVDYHWGSMLKAAMVSTLLGVGTEMATDNDNDLIQALRYGTQDTVNQTGRGLVQREINIPPTISIRPGYPLRVIVTRDLVVQPLGEM